MNRLILLQVGFSHGRRVRCEHAPPEEVRSMNQKIDELPAGGSSLPGAAVLVFLVLLFTDIMGFTDVFPFVKKTAR